VLSDAKKKKKKKKKGIFEQRGWKRKTQRKKVIL
jgi:hypothetical protein